MRCIRTRSAPIFARHYCGAKRLVEARATGAIGFRAAITRSRQGKSKNRDTASDAGLGERMMDVTNRVEGIAYNVIPVTNVDQSVEWYKKHLHFEVQHQRDDYAGLFFLIIDRY